LIRLWMVMGFSSAKGLAPKAPVVGSRFMY
jgi:hypothetical protein